MRANNNENSAIHCTHRATATPHYQAVGGAIGREHEYRAESVSKAGLKTRSDSQEESITSKKQVEKILGLMIPESLENNSYIDQLAVFLDCRFWGLSIECIEDAIKMNIETHTFKAMLKQVLSLKNNQLDLFNNKNGVATLERPTPDCKPMEANNETYCNEK